MASSSDSWVKEFNEASKFADDINARLGERSSLPPIEPKMQRHLSAIRNKITILGTRLDTLENILPKLTSRQPMKNMPIRHRFGVWESVYFIGSLLAFLKNFMFNFLGGRC